MNQEMNRRRVVSVVVMVLAYGALVWRGLSTESAAVSVLLGCAAYWIFVDHRVFKK